MPGTVAQATGPSGGGRDLGFSIVKSIAQKHIAALTERIAAMQSMQRTLQTLVHCCHGDDRPDCPILDDLASADTDLTPIHHEPVAPTPKRQPKAAA